VVDVEESMTPIAPIATAQMTAETWQTTNDAVAMLEHRLCMRSPDSGYADPRPAWLYLLACSRRAWPRLPWLMRMLVEVAELFPDQHPVETSLRTAATNAAASLLSFEDPDEALAEAEGNFSTTGRSRPHGTSQLVPHGKAWTGLSTMIYYLFTSEIPLFRRIPDEFHSADLVREIFGNPFHLMLFPFQWKTRNAIDLARGMYHTRDFRAMPFLADALEEAGCNDVEVLQHCRGDNTHVRGCWVIDNLLSPADRRKPRQGATEA
jgi:hypothetical protein